jgi:cell division protein FtsN
MEETSLLPPQPVLNQNPHYKLSLYKVLIISLVVSFAFAAGYYFSFKESEHAKRSSVVPQKIAPLRVPQAEIDKNIQFLKPAVQVQKAADVRQTEPGNNNDSLPIAKPASLPASQTAAPPAHKEGTSSAAIKESKPAEPAPTVASVEDKPAQPPVEEKKVIVPPQQEAAVKATTYCVNVASYKLKESAELTIKDLQKKGYEPEVDTITVKDTTWYRVTLGNFQTQKEAQNYARELQSKENIKGFVVKNK